MSKCESFWLKLVKVYLITSSYSHPAALMIVSIVDEIYGKEIVVGTADPAPTNLMYSFHRL